MAGNLSILGRDRALKQTRENLKAAKTEIELLRKYITALEALAVRSIDNCPKQIKKIAKLRKDLNP